MTIVIRMFVVIIVTILILMAVSSCAMLQPRANPGDALADLPTTGPEAMFQTLKKANWLYTLSIIGIGAGFYAFLNGSGKGIHIMAACFVVLSVIIGVTRYSAIIAAISMLGAVALMIYSTLVKGKALREVVRGVEDVKLADAVRSSDSTLGLTELGISNKLAEYQSKTTEAIVKAVKGTL